MITSFLPTFKVFEVNDLVGLRNGHMMSQIPAAADIATVTKGDAEYIENGIIVGLNADGTIGNYDAATHKVPFVHYTEELLTWINELKYFAVPVETDGTYPRCIALYVGDTFTTNNYVADDVTGEAYAAVEDGVLTLQATAEGAMFKATPSTLPDGSDAYEFLYLGVIEAIDEEVTTDGN